MAAPYRFRTRWFIAVPPDRCWDEILAALRPGAATWWPGVHVESAPERLEAGGRVVLAVRSPVGYRLRMRLDLTSVVPGTSLEAASVGDLDGTGAMVLQPAAGGTAIIFRWEVRLRRRWMRATSAVLRPVFVAAHTAVMRRGESGFRRRVSDAPGPR
jgi:hypothetical protein